MPVSNMAVRGTIVYQDGWFDEEHDGVRLFRWMSRHARCSLTGVPASGALWLRVTAGHGWPTASAPVLSVSVNGRVVGERRVRGPFGDYLFPVGGGSDVEIIFTLDRTFTVAGDDRDLGVMVRGIEVIDLTRAKTPIDAAGWYEWEHHAYFPFRWMGLEARLLVPPCVLERGRFASLPVYTETEAGYQSLAVLAGETTVAQLSLLHGWHVYDFALPARATGTGGAARSPLDLVLRVSELLPLDRHQSDPRDLSVGVGQLEVHDDARRHERVRVFHEWTRGSATPRAVDHGAAPGHRPSDDPVLPQAHSFNSRDVYLPQDGEGWYVWEFQDHIPFRWTTREASISVPAGVWTGHRFCTFPIFSEYGDLTQVVTVSSKGRTLAELPLGRFWNYCSLEMPEPSRQDLELRFRVNKMLPPNYGRNDPRRLGVRVGPLAFHDDEAWHERTRFFYENAVLNARELRAGATVLKSFPTNLGIDLYGKCNIKPPCVYCLWDETKEIEGADTGAIVDDRTLEQYGPFFRGAQSLVNCSFGEPLLHPRLEEILDLVSNHDKLLELSTNGQAFTPANVRALAGRPVVLYVSLDAASSEVYARLRNDRWHEVITGLTFLRDARRRANGLPKLNMVFMPMRANLCDLEAYFRLCRMVEANLLVLRPLNYLANASITIDRGGYQFDYGQELLSVEQIQAVVRDCEAYAATYHVLVANQFDFGLARPPIGRPDEGKGRGDGTFEG